MQAQILNQLDELIGIIAVGGVPGLFQPPRPAPEIAGLELKQGPVAGLLEQLTVRLITFGNGSKFAEKVFVRIICKIAAMPFPASAREALDAKVVVVFNR